MRKLSRRQLAWRAAQDIWDGAVVNLGIGLPTACADYLPQGREIILHSENGLLGMGPAPPPGEEDPDLINAGKQHVTLIPGGSYFHHNDAFVMIRGGHIHLSIMGAFEVSEAGDLANWTTAAPGTPPGVGGAMDLAAGSALVWVMMEHTTREGRPRIRRECGYPLTAPRCVSRIYTDLAVLEVAPEALVVTEMVEGADLSSLQGRTEAELQLAPDWGVLAAPALG